MPFVFWPFLPIENKHEAHISLRAKKKEKEKRWLLASRDVFCIQISDHRSLFTIFLSISKLWMNKMFSA